MLDSSWPNVRHEISENYNASTAENEFIDCMATECVTDASTTAIVKKLLDKPSKTSIDSSVIESKVINSKPLIEILAEPDSIVDAEANGNKLVNGSPANHLTIETKSSIIFHCENLELLNFSKSEVDEVDESIIYSDSGIESNSCSTQCENQSHVEPI